MTNNDLNIDFPGVRLTSFALFSQVVVVALVSTTLESHCPECRTTSDRIHSRYLRTVADLPGHGRSVVFRITVRRFRCLQPDCSRTVFCERLPAFVAPYARTTDRLDKVHSSIGFALGGEPGRRLTEHLAIPTSGDTLLRRVQSSPAPPMEAVRFVGIDDWAFRKGQRYGTIVVDLESGRVLDVLPDRESETIATWLKQHPGVEIISRDRAGAYAKGASDGAPEAQQVADRWHLLKNLRETMERLFERLDGTIQESIQSLDSNAETATPVPNEVSTPIELQSSACETQRPATIEPPAVSEPARDPRCETFRQVRELAGEGHSIREIAQKLGLARNTVRRYVRTGRLPDRKRGSIRASKLSSHREWLDGRIADGVTQASQLHRELRDQGVHISGATVRRMVARRLVQLGKSSKRASPTAKADKRKITSRQLAFDWVKRLETRTDLQKQRLETIRDRSPELKDGLDLADRFADLIRKKGGDRFDQWLLDAQGSSCPELRRFAEGIAQDETAVRAAIECEFSNGPVEGHVNRLKVIKRQMYGRAGLELLRKRVLMQSR